jgi:hypothetical protein
MNGKVTGHRTTGDARFTIEDDSLTITVKVKGAAPGITHWQVRTMNKRDTLVALVTSVSALANGEQQRVDPSGAIAACCERPYVCV